MKTTIGGDRLGSGNKQEVSMRNYERSTHDLSYTWRSSMAPGTLVPFMKRLALPGDSFDINLNCQVLTLPTLGPLFGSFKVQLDVFFCPIRLYNARLHMNELGIGLEMKNVKLPQIRVAAKKYGPWNNYLQDNFQINPSSLLKYLGISGVGNPDASVADGATFERDFNAVPFLAYWDIYKQYYANKQEEEGACIHWNIAGNYIRPESAEVLVGYTWKPCFKQEEAQAVNWALNPKVRIYFRNGEDEPDPATLEIRAGNLEYLPEFFNTIVWDPVNFMLELSDPVITTGTVAEFYVMDTAGKAADEENRRSVQVQRFPLKNIDTMRKLILRWDQDTVAPIVGLSTFAIAPYNYYRSGVPGGEYGNKFAISYAQELLALKTYQSDLFNNWISTEWIDGPNGINEITSVDTTGDSFTIDALNLAKKVYVMLNRIAISGGTYDDWLDAVYTHERRRGTENPMYMGSLIKELSFQEVVSNADQELPQELGGYQPLGKLSGRGRLTNKNKGGRIKIKADEPGYILGIVSITPRIDYSQGNEWDVNLKTLDDLHKPALDAIGYQDLVTDQMAWQDSYVANDRSVSLHSIGKQPAWINYMTEVNKVYGNFASQMPDNFMTLTRRYNYTELGISDFTTYVDPSLFNFIFAKTDLASMNFWVQIANNITARRKMSAKVIPNL